VVTLAYNLSIQDRGVVALSHPFAGCAFGKQLRHDPLEHLCVDFDPLFDVLMLQSVEKLYPNYLRIWKTTTHTITSVFHTHPVCEIGGATNRGFDPIVFAMERELIALRKKIGVFDKTPIRIGEFDEFATPQLCIRSRVPRDYLLPREPPATAESSSVRIAVSFRIIRGNRLLMDGENAANLKQFCRIIYKHMYYYMKSHDDPFGFIAFHLGFTNFLVLIHCDVPRAYPFFFRMKFLFERPALYWAAWFALTLLPFISPDPFGFISRSKVKRDDKVTEAKVQKDMVDLLVHCCVFFNKLLDGFSANADLESQEHWNFATVSTVNGGSHNLIAERLAVGVDVSKISDNLYFMDFFSDHCAEAEVVRGLLLAKYNEMLENSSNEPPFLPFFMPCVGTNMFVPKLGRNIVEGSLTNWSKLKDMWSEITARMTKSAPVDVEGYNYSKFGIRAASLRDPSSTNVFKLLTAIPVSHPLRLVQPNPLPHPPVDYIWPNYSTSKAEYDFMYRQPDPNSYSSYATYTPLEIGRLDCSIMTLERMQESDGGAHLPDFVKTFNFLAPALEHSSDEVRHDTTRNYQIVQCLHEYSEQLSMISIATVGTASKELKQTQIISALRRMCTIAQVANVSIEEFKSAARKTQKQKRIATEIVPVLARAPPSGTLEQNRHTIGTHFHPESVDPVDPEDEADFEALFHPVTITNTQAGDPTTVPESQSQPNQISQLVDEFYARQQQVPSELQVVRPDIDKDRDPEGIM